MLPPSKLYPFTGLSSVSIAPFAYCIPPASSSSKTICVKSAVSSSIFLLETVISHIGRPESVPSARTALTSLAAFVRPGAVFLITCFKVKSAVSVIVLPGFPSIKTSLFAVTCALFWNNSETRSTFSGSAHCFCNSVAIWAALVSVNFTVYLNIKNSLLFIHQSKSNNAPVA